MPSCTTNSCPQAILNRARREAELVSVGKRKGRASWAQADIEAEMIRRVRAGQTVVRLKAGDPFVFGRGGEEVDALRAAGLPVSVVPGITAALGAAAAAGIPADRPACRFVRHLHVGPCRGAMPAAGTPTSSTWAHRKPLPCAIVCWTPALLPPTPVAIVENGTRPDRTGFDRSLSPTWRGSLFPTLPGRRRSQSHHRG